jgi:hypothetical protein
VQLSQLHDAPRRISECTLEIVDWNWPLAARHANEIARNWQRVSTANPRFFNGAVYLFRDYVIDGTRLTGTLFRTDFQTMLYWRSLPFGASDDAREVFGVSLIRSADGHLLFGRQGPGQLNSGFIYPPSGVIDDHDASGSTIDIDANITRELHEETGIPVGELFREPGYLVVTTATQIAIGVEWRSPLPANELREKIMSFLSSEAHSELDDIVIVRGPGDIDHARMPPHARAFAQHMIGAGGR